MHSIGKLQWSCTCSVGGCTKHKQVSKLNKLFLTASVGRPWQFHSNISMGLDSTDVRLKGRLAGKFS